MKDARQIVQSAISLMILTVTMLGAEAAEVTERVVLDNGNIYDIHTEDGMPIPFKSDLIDISGLSILLGADFEWSLVAELREQGKFVVTVTTLIDSSISDTFECAGPGKVVETFFKSRDYPMMWEWLQNRETSWIPFVFNFQEKGSGRKFEVTQWTKFDPQVKDRIRQVLEQVHQK